MRITQELLQAALSRIGKKGGQSRSQAKIAAAVRNAETARLAKSVKRQLSEREAGI